MQYLQLLIVTVLLSIAPTGHSFAALRLATLDHTPEDFGRASAGAVLHRSVFALRDHAKVKSYGSALGARRGSVGVPWFMNGSEIGESKRQVIMDGAFVLRRGTQRDLPALTDLSVHVGVLFLQCLSA